MGLTARDRARRLLAEYGIESPPTPDGLVYLLSDHLLVKTREMPQELSGLLVRSHPKSVIWLRASDPPTRRRFTLWHEAGHLLMHRGTYYCMARGSQEEDKEREANRFAVEVLMPKHWLYRDLAERGLDPRRLAERYQVSRQAMEIRLKELGLG